MPARKISFVNFKGGVGKTSLSVNIAACLAHELKQKVLLVDCDPQSNASVWLMNIYPWTKLNPEETILALFDSDRPPLQDIIQKDIVRDREQTVLIRNLDLLPAVYDLMEIESHALNKRKPHYISFYEAISVFENHYDYIIFDCPPGLTRVCQSAIFASDEIFVPCNPDELSRIGLDFLNTKLIEMEEETRRQADNLPGFQFPKVRAVIYNSVNRTAKNDAMDYIDQKVNDLKKESPVFDRNSTIFTISISQAVALPRAISTFTPVTLENSSKIKDEYTALSQYVVSMKKKRGAKRS